MARITISNELSKMLPTLRLGCFECTVKTEHSNDELLKHAETIINRLRSDCTLDEISKRPGVRATKEAYRMLGKDPSRYRPSAEALCRRIIQGKDLYHINNVVDLLNVISLDTGLSIGGYDAEKIQGDIVLSIGRTDEPYDAIGRGELNIENIPVFRDRIGAFGSPTSDSRRTMVTDDTTHFLMVIFDFDGLADLQAILEKCTQWYAAFTGAGNIRTEIIPAHP